MNLGTIGRSPEGLRIFEMGAKFCKEQEAKKAAAVKAERKKLARRMSRQKRAVDKAWAKEMAKPENWMGPVATIIAEVAESCGLTVDEIKSHRRFKTIAKARLEIYYRCAMETGATFVLIGKSTNRDHSTVIHGIRHYAERTGLPLPGGMQ